MARRKRLRDLPLFAQPHGRFLAVTLGSFVFAGVLLLGLTTSAGTAFRVRGVVKDTDASNKVITITVTHIEKGWPAARFEKNPYTVRISKSGARVLKYNSAGQAVRLGLKSIIKDDVVNVIGETRTDGTLDASTVIIR